MTALTEKAHASQALVSEADGFVCRDTITIAESQTLQACSVIGKVLANEGAISVGNPAIVGTGNGVLTKADPAYSSDVQEGTYRVNVVGATTDTCDFEVVRPDGTVDGIGKTGVAYDGQVKFTLADGSADFVVGSYITLAVSIAEAADAGQWKGHDPDATDGAEVAAGVVIYPVTTGSGETKKAAAWVRGPMELRGVDLVWPHTGISAGEKAAAIAQLATLGIIVR